MITDSNKDNRDVGMTCLHFFTTFYKKCTDIIVLDTENTVYKEYMDNIDQKSLTLPILKNILFRNKTTWISKNGLQIHKILKEVSFDPDEVKFLELNAKLGGENTIIITTDSDFVKLKRMLENNFNLRSRLRNPNIMSPEEIVEKYYQ